MNGYNFLFSANEKYCSFARMIWSRNVIRTASALFFWAKIHIIPDILVGGSSFFAGNFVGTEKK